MPADFPALMDPRMLGILSAVSQGLQMSGPSLMPRSVGQIAGGALGSGIGTYQSAMEAKRKAQQTEALIQLERQKALQSELATRVQFEDQNMRRGMLGLPPIPMPGQGVGGPAAAQGVGGGMPAPQGGAATGMVPLAPPGGGQPNLMQTIQSLPPGLRQAAIADIGMNGGKGLAEIIAKANEPVVGREGGIYRRAADGSIELDPGWLKGERARRGLAAEVEGDNTLVDVEMPDGTKQRMTKAAALRLAGGGQSGGQGTNLPTYQDALDMAQSRSKRGEKFNIEYNPATAPQMPGFSTGISTDRRIENVGREAAVTETAKKDSDTVSTYRQKLPAMASAMVSVRQLKDLNQDDKTYASAGAEFKKDLGRIAQAFGFKVNEKETANTELYVARMGELIKERLASKDYGSGTGVSNLDILTASVPLPELSKSGPGRQKILDALEKDLLRSYNDMRGAVDHFEEKKTLRGFKFPSEVLLERTPPQIPKTPAPNRPRSREDILKQYGVSR